jgi:hypothetical protein
VLLDKIRQPLGSGRVSVAFFMCLTVRHRFHLIELEEFEREGAIATASKSYFYRYKRQFLLESWLQSKTLSFPLLGLVPVLSLLSIF